MGIIMSYKFNSRYKLGNYEIVISNSDVTTILNLDAKELIELYNTVEFYLKKATYEIGEK